MNPSTAQWVLCALAIGAYLSGASQNASIAWREWYHGDSRGPSLNPVIFGMIGVFAVLAAPFGTLADRLWWVWVPLLLDFGSLPYLVFSIWKKFY
jgi:hypothetical protein